MKLAFVVLTDFPERTAPARRVGLLGKGLALRGHDVHVLVPQRFSEGPLVEQYEGMQVRWCETAGRAALTQLSKRINARIALVREVDRLAQKGLDWLFTYNLGLDAFPMALSAKLRGGHVAAMYDDLRAYPEHRSLEDHLRRLWLEAADTALPRRSDLNIAISNFLANRLATVAPDVPRLVIPPLVDTERFQSDASLGAAFRSHWGLGNTFLISFLGSFWHVEGVAVLLKAVAEMVRDELVFKVAISGEATRGLDCDDVPRLVHEYGLEEVVTLTGWLTTQDVIGAMSAADILVVPKLDHIANQAGVPTKLAEYLSMARPVVVSAVGDIPLYVSHGEAVLFCEPGNSSSLQSALITLIKSPSLRVQLAQGARAAALDHFSYEKAARRVEESLRMAMGTRRATGD